MVLYGGSEVTSTILWKAYSLNSRGNAKHCFAGTGLQKILEWSTRVRCYDLSVEPSGRLHGHRSEIREVSRLEYLVSNGKTSSVCCILQQCGSTTDLKAKTFILFYQAIYRFL